MTAPQLFTDLTPAPQRTRHTTAGKPTYIPPLSNLTRQTQCSACHAVVLETLDAPHLAFHVQLDPVNITDPHAELQLLLAGRRTYTATPHTPGRYRPHRRDSYEITRTTHTRPLVLAEHRCDQPTPGQPLPAPARPTLDGPCPFDPRDHPMTRQPQTRQLPAAGGTA